MSVGIQKMVRSDFGASGVMFTIDTESGFRNVVFINTIFGLGENIVQGHVDPDEYYVFKPTKEIIYRRLGKKAMKMVYNFSGEKTVKNIPIPAARQNRSGPFRPPGAATGQMGFDY